MRRQRGSLKEAILTKKANLAKLAKMAHPRQSLANVPKTCQRLPLESGDFGENGKCCEHPPVLGKIQMRWKKGPLKVVIFTKMANMVRFRHSLSYKSNKTDRIQTFRIGDGRGEGGGAPKTIFSALRASVWFKNKGGRTPGPSPGSIRHCKMAKGSPLKVPILPKMAKIHQSLTKN